MKSNKFKLLKEYLFIKADTN